MPEIDMLMRSARRTVSIEIAKDGRLVVRAPHRASLALIEGFVRDKASWIERKQGEVRSRQAACVPHRFAEGEEFLYLGERYPLRIVDDERALTLDGAFRLSQEHCHHPHIVFTNWYRKEASRAIGGRLEYYSVMTGLTYRSFRITGARSRWGSCGRDGSLTFSWRLIMAPLFVVDYVVAHELAHTAVHDHSRRFWERVERIMPDYSRARQWLREHGHRLTLVS